jgi:hypothetical protein
MINDRQLMDEVEKLIRVNTMKSGVWDGNHFTAEDGTTYSNVILSSNDVGSGFIVWWNEQNSWLFVAANKSQVTRTDLVSHRHLNHKPQTEIEKARAYVLFFELELLDLYEIHITGSLDDFNGHHSVDDIYYVGVPVGSSAPFVVAPTVEGHLTTNAPLLTAFNCSSENQFLFQEITLEYYNSKGHGGSDHYIDDIVNIIEGSVGQCFETITFGNQIGSYYSNDIIIYIINSGGVVNVSSTKTTIEAHPEVVQYGYYSTGIAHFFLGGNTSQKLFISKFLTISYVETTSFDDIRGYISVDDRSNIDIFLGRKSIYDNNSGDNIQFKVKDRTVTEILANTSIGLTPLFGWRFVVATECNIFKNFTRNVNFVKKNTVMLTLPIADTPENRAAILLISTYSGFYFDSWDQSTIPVDMSTIRTNTSTFTATKQSANLVAPGEGSCVLGTKSSVKVKIFSLDSPSAIICSIAITL